MIRKQLLTEHTGRPAVFLDRDGTVTMYRGYITKPEQIEPERGAGNAIRSLSNSGFACVLVTNQSAIARGMLTESQLAEIHQCLIRRLAKSGASLDAIYYCPDFPEERDETIVANPDRKPAAGMLLQAAADLQIDLSASWMIGDRVSDMLAGMNAGCRECIRVRTGFSYPDGVPHINGRYQTVPSIVDAVQLVLSKSF